MRSKLDRQLELRDSLHTQIQSVYRRARETSSPHGLIMDNLHSRSWNRVGGLPRYMVEYLRGASHALSDDLFREDLVHAYRIGCEILPIDSEAYRSLSPRLVSENATWHGHVWRSTLRPYYPSPD